MRAFFLCSTLAIEIHMWTRTQTIRNLGCIVMSFHGYRAEDGPTCIVIQALDEDSRKSRFTWLLNMDVKVKVIFIVFPIL